MSISKPALQTKGQLQRTLSQQIQKLYKETLGQSPSKVTCQIMDDKVAVVIEDSLTKVERILIEEHCSVQQVSKIDVERIRAEVDSAVRPRIVDLVEQNLPVKVVDLLSDTALGTGRTGILIILSEAPKVSVARKTAQ